MCKLKQVIIVRKDLNMRKGKMIAQGAHASLTAALAAQAGSPSWLAHFTSWFSGDQRKIAVGAPDEDTLHRVYAQAKAAGLPAALILDHGLTEFGGVPTYTAVAIGPAEDGDIDQITGKLSLL
ncbi:aminoacyl-tRNA hydrolase [Acidithiobacillus thiooxidans]|uniref:aminoacyl-tRNA hydrolase n=1 Tax=Acidithiobacillus thiooxidans TaxID=930 RepID=UPI001C0756CB|nr:aminoacyl-tRNA hydrolase [Acidithiobacillus thiooxidans]MBU2793107.1 aminoacyl-tRNA hydrolase [Acidithiobacillus thiooxidans]